MLVYLSRCRFRYESRIVLVLEMCRESRLVSSTRDGDAGRLAGGVLGRRRQLDPEEGEITGPRMVGHLQSCLAGKS